MLTISDAIDAFITGWVYSRQKERDISVSRLDSITHLRFGDATSVRPRFDEFMIYETPPADVIQLVQQTAVNIPHFLSIFTNQVEATLSAYAHYNYHLHSREYLMALQLLVHHLSSETAVAVGRVTSEAERQWYNAAHERKVIPLQTLTDSQIGYYFIHFDDDLVCEGRAVLTSENIALIDSVYTADAYRRRGLGSALMSKILKDAAARGAPYSVLVASEDGRKLYLRLGYQVLADMLILEAGQVAKDELVARTQ